MIVNVSDVLNFTHAYRQVRGWDIRRIYVTRTELVKLLSEQPHTPIIGAAAGEIMVDGAVVRAVSNAAVCEAIRTWDMERAP